MNTTTAALVLATAASFDQSFAKPDPAIATAWGMALNHLDPKDALQSVIDHYGAETRRLMPADVTRGVRRIRADRIAATVEPAPICDPDDVPTYLRLARENRRTIADGKAPPVAPTPLTARPVAQLIQSTLDTHNRRTA